MPMYLLLMACIFSVTKCGKILSNSIYLLMQLALSALVQFSATTGAMANGRLIGYIVTSLIFSALFLVHVYMWGQKMRNQSIFFHG